jgi:hypothetical protein
MQKLNIVVFTLLLAACSEIPVKTLYTLATTDTNKVNPGALRTATRLPDWLEPQPNGAKLTLRAESAGQTPLNEVLVLEAFNPAAENSNSPIAGQAGTHLYFYRLSAADIERVEQFREQLKQRKAQGIKVSSSVGVSVDACRKTAIPAGKVPVTNYLKIDKNGDYLPLLVNYDLKEALQKEIKDKRIEDLLPLCKS